jgi:hypothetical protein
LDPLRMRITLIRAQNGLYGLTPVILLRVIGSNQKSPTFGTWRGGW